MASYTHKSVKLSSGHDMPVLGLGTWQSGPNEVALAVEHALKSGYRHIDGAAVYGNEHEVGAGIRASGVPREKIFVTSKLWNNSHHPDWVERALDQTLSDLGLEYLDLYLIHWPVAFVPGTNKFPKDSNGWTLVDKTITIEQTWKAMEKLVASGKVRSIGVSNCAVVHLERIIKVATIKPAVNQVEAHPYLVQPELLTYEKEHNIVPTAYSSLGNKVYGRKTVLEEEAIQEAAKSINKNAANVILSYLVEKGFVVIPKSVTPSRIDANMDLFELPKEVFDKLDSLDEHRRYNDDSPNWGVDVLGEWGGDEKAFEEMKRRAAADKKK